MKKPNTYKWLIEIEVDEVWVKDGFNPDAGQWKDAIMDSMLDYAATDEVKVRVVKAPNPKQIAKAHGYES